MVSKSSAVCTLVVLAAAALVALAPTDLWADVAPLPTDLTRGQARAIMLAALAGLVILGFALVTLVWLGARFTHRYRHGGRPLQPTPRPGEHDWAKKPLQGPGQSDS